MAGNPVYSDFLTGTNKLINKKQRLSQAVTASSVFHPKARNVGCYWQVFWLSCFFRAFPSVLFEQWHWEIECPEKPIVIHDTGLQLRG